MKEKGTAYLRYGHGDKRVEKPEREEMRMAEQSVYVHSYYAQDKLLSSLSVYNVGSQKCTPGFQWGPGVRDHYLIHHVLQGKGKFETQGKVYHLKQGDTFLIYPDMEACYRADEEDPWEYTWVGFDGTDAFSLLNHTDFSEGSPVLEQASLSEEIARRIGQVYHVKGNSFYDAVAMTGALYSMIAMLMENSSHDIRQKNLQSELVERAMRYTEEHYSYPITVEDIAEYAGVCRSYLYRVFQKKIKKSPKDYLEECRIRQACQLLGTDSISVTAVAHSVGYEDNLYFSKVFKKKVGITPSDFRKQKSERKE